LKIIFQPRGVCKPFFRVYALFKEVKGMKRALILSADGFEEAELLVPYYRLLEEGLQVKIASLRPGPIRGKHGYSIQAHLAAADARAQEYDILIIPGGRAPEALKRSEAVLSLLRAFHQAGRPIAAICHGPQVLAAAGLLKGRRATCYYGVAQELRALGARYEDEAVVVDGPLITSRQPSDLPVFMRQVLRALGA